MVVEVTGSFYTFDHGDACFVVFRDMGNASKRNVVLWHICEIGVFLELAVIVFRVLFGIHS